MRMIVFVCFVGLRPMSTAMDMAAERSVNLTTLFTGQA